ncbi:hypothetical protein GE061_019012 [Apolygus lucorum]|uniref:RNase H type-1 domain-containing protein n=1 Tax=Apolygus lucorum TaxID=248454 RepID=A0A8S9X8J1_APOLU|nr:hypothetical protein GE061_019012 [Apolygus lucorum]
MNYTKLCSSEIPGMEKKSTISSVEAKQMAQQLLSSKYREHTSIYSDGARNADGTAAAFFCTKCNVGQGMRLRPISSSFHAELAGLKMALHHAKHLHQGQGIVVLSDSKSTVDALSHLRRGDPIPIELLELSQLIEFIAGQTSSLKLQWIPSHVGLQFNEKVDKMASNEIRHGEISNSITSHFTDVYQLIVKHQRQVWSTTYTNANGAGAWTRAIIQDPLRSPWFSGRKDLNRRYITTINRLILGHAFTNSKFLMKKRNDPDCDLCDRHMVQDLQHLLLKCTRTQTSLNPVLHDGTVGVDDRTRVLEYLKRALNNTQLFRELWDMLNILQIQF